VTKIIQAILAPLDGDETRADTDYAAVGLAATTRHRFTPALPERDHDRARQLHAAAPPQSGLFEDVTFG